MRCDILSFKSQKKLFKAAKESSPEMSVDIVVPCAGIAPKDTIYHTEGRCTYIQMDRSSSYIC